MKKFKPTSMKKKDRFPTPEQVATWAEPRTPGVYTSRDNNVQVTITDTPSVRLVYLDIGYQRRVYTFKIENNG